MDNKYAPLASDAWCVKVYNSYNRNNKNILRILHINAINKITETTQKDEGNILRK